VHEAAIAFDIGSKDRGQPPFHSGAFHGSTLPTQPNKRQLVSVRPGKAPGFLCREFHWREHTIRGQHQSHGEDPWRPETRLPAYILMQVVV
jgi:hypothetical protein